MPESKIASKRNTNKIVFTFAYFAFLFFMVGYLTDYVWWRISEPAEKKACFEEGFNRGVGSVKVISIGEQLKNVANEMRNNPQGMKDFLGEAVDTAIKASPSLAIQFENYASEKTKKEMEQLRGSADLKLLLRQKQEIEAFKVQIYSLQKEKDQIPNLHQQIAHLKEENQSIPKLKGQVESLQKNNSALQAENSRIPRLEAEVSQLNKKKRFYSFIAAGNNKASGKDIGFAKRRRRRTQSFC